MANKSRQLPLVIDIPAPCAADWNGMPGDERVRHCAVCDKDVHSLSELSAAGIASLLERGNVCLRLRIEADGSVVHRRRRSNGRAARIVATAALAAMAACGKQTQGSPPLPANEATAAPANAVAPATTVEPDTSALPAVIGSAASPPPPVPSGKPPRGQHIMGTRPRFDEPPGAAAPVEKAAGKVED